MGARNSKVEYEKNGNLSFEYRHARNAGLSYEVAQAIEKYGCGYGPVVYHLINKGFKSSRAVKGYIEGLGCLHHGDDEATMNALADKLKV